MENEEVEYLLKQKVRPGAVTTLGVTQTGDGRLKFNISEGEAIDVRFC